METHLVFNNALKMLHFNIIYAFLMGVLYLDKKFFKCYYLFKNFQRTFKSNIPIMSGK